MRRHNPHRGSPAAPVTAYGENSRSPQTVHTPPAMGAMASRHSWQTGKREIFTNAVPQMRQSEGNKTAKRLPAIWPVQPRPTWCTLIWVRLAPEAIGGLATAALAWLARILSPLLLKTASVLPARGLSWAGDCAIACLPSSITAAGYAKQRYDRFAAPGPLFS